MSWLVRKSTLEILGPMEAEDLKAAIQKGDLHLEDEVCDAGKYWFFLHEAEELKSQLGVLPPPRRKKKNDEEETLTETEVGSESTDEITPIAFQPSPDSDWMKVPSVQEPLNLASARDKRDMGVEGAGAAFDPDLQQGPSLLSIGLILVGVAFVVFLMVLLKGV